MRISYYVIIKVLSLLWILDSMCWSRGSSYGKKHETMEQLLASGRIVQNQNKEISDSIVAFDAYRNSKAHNRSWNGPVPTIKPIVRDYDYFAYEDHQVKKEDPSSNKTRYMDSDNDSTEPSLTPTPVENDDSSASFETLQQESNKENYRSIESSGESAKDGEMMED